MSLTVTTGANTVLIFYNSRLLTEAWHGHGQFRLLVDGTVVGDTSFESYSTSGGAHDDYNWDEYWMDYCASTMWCVTLAAGQHTIKVQWACDEGAVGTKWRRLMAVELK